MSPKHTGEPDAAATARFPAHAVQAGHVEPVPRRIRATIGARTVLDTERALYVWELPYYPQFYIPVGDVSVGVLVPEGQERDLERGTARRHGIRVDDQERSDAAEVYSESSLPGVRGTVRFDWDAVDAWYEEDERVFVHPRSPYSRVDAIRSNRRVQVAVDGVEVADAGSAVLVFETGLPTRYYLDRTAVDFEHLRPSATETSCPYKGTTSEYWSVQVGDHLRADLAWAYDFPTRALDPISGLIAFYNEKVDIRIDGVLQERPKTHF